MTTPRINRKRSKTPTRYTPKQRAAILVEAKAKRFTGEEVAAKYGIARITFYLWRRASGEKWHGVGKRGPKGTTGRRPLELSRSARTRIKRVISEVVSEQVAAAFSYLSRPMPSRSARRTSL